MNYKFTILRYSAIIAFGFYLLWNLYFLLNAQLPPSILYELTGIPSPTTGMYRSAIALVYLDLNGFLMNNPLVVLFIPILAFILISLSVSCFRRKELELKKQYTSALFVTLFLGEFIAIKNYLL